MWRGCKLSSSVMRNIMSRDWGICSVVPLVWVNYNNQLRERIHVQTSGYCNSLMFFCIPVSHHQCRVVFSAHNRAAGILIIRCFFNSSEPAGRWCWYSSVSCLIPSYSVLVEKWKWVSTLYIKLRQDNPSLCLRFFTQWIVSIHWNYFYTLVLTHFRRAAYRYTAKRCVSVHGTSRMS